MLKIFENAKFGDKFLTRGGDEAIFLSKSKHGWMCAIKTGPDKSIQHTYASIYGLYCGGEYGEVQTSVSLHDIISKE